MISRNVSLVFWLCAFALSFTFLPHYQNQMMGGTLLCLLLAVALPFYADLRDRQWRIQKNPALMILFMFWAVTLGSVLWSHIPWISQIQFLVFSCFPLSALLFMNRETDGVVKAILFILSLFSLFALYQYYLLPDMLYEGRVKWPLKNPNSLGAVFSIGAFLALGLLLQKRSYWILFACILMILGLIVTGSRGALGAFLLGLFFLLIVARSKEIISYKTGMLAVFVLILAGLITYTGARPENMALVSSVLTATGEHSLLWSRGDLWASTWTLIKAHPWLGTGIGTFPQFYEEHRTVTELSAGFMAHNDPLQYWAEMGVVAFVLFYVFVVVISWRTWCFVKNHSEPKERLTVLIPFVAMGAMVLHTHVSFNLHTIPILFMVGLCFAMWCRAISEQEYLISVPKWLSFQNTQALYTGAFVLILFVSLLPFGAQHYIERANYYSARGNVEKTVDAINTAQRWSMGRNATPYLLALPLQISMLEHDLDILLPSLREEELNKLTAQIDRAEALNPRAVGVPYNRALLAQILTDNNPAYGEIDQHLMRALVLKPRHFRSRFWLIDRHLERGELDQAITLLKPAMGWCTRSVYGQECLSRMATMLMQRGDVQEAQDVLKRLKSLQDRKRSK